MLAGTPALAQIEEITVTARKVAEDIKEVPLAITAFSSQEIESAGINNLDDVAALTPGLQFFNAIGEFLPVPIIRGVAPTDIFGENNAAIFVDGIYVSGREGLNFSQLDLERIEVLKGPQSAQYGRNAFSGAINYVTRRPTDEFEAKAELTGGNEGKALGSASVSGPLVGDWLKGRAAFVYDEWDGSYDNPLSGVDVGGYRYRSWQGSLLFTPSDSLDILLSGYYSNDEIDESATTSLTANCEDVATVSERFQNSQGVPYGPRLANWCGELPSLGDDPILSQIPGYDDNDIPKIKRALGEDREVTRLTLNIDWDVGFGTITALSGYTNTEQSALTDGTRSLGNDQPFVYCTGAVDRDDPDQAGLCFLGVNGLPSLAIVNAGLEQISPGDETDEFSQELRFTSPQDRPFRYSVGAYYFNVQLDQTETGLISTRSLPDDYGWFCPCLNLGPGTILGIGYPAFEPWFTPTGDVDPRLAVTRETDSWAGFGYVEQDVGKFTFRAEARYTDEDKEITVYDYNPAALAPTENRKENFDFWTGQLNIKYNVSDDWMLYTYIAKGEKSGGYDFNNVDLIDESGTETEFVCDNLDTPDTVEQCIVILPFDTEQNITTEVGVKGRTADGRIGVDLALYRIDWEDIVIPQIISTDPETGLPFEQPEGFNFNAGDATVWGWELGLDLVFTDNLTGRFGLSWTDSTFDDAKQESFAEFPSFAPDGDVSGNQLLRQSEWQANGSLIYNRQLTNDWEWFTRADVTYQDEWYIGSDNQGTVPDHTYVNLRLGFESDRYTIEFWGDNLFEDDAPSGAFRDVYFGNTNPEAQANGPTSGFVSDFFPWRMTVSHPRLRTYGVTARVRFGGARK